MPEQQIKISLATWVRTNNKLQIIIMGYGNSLSYFMFSYYERIRTSESLQTSHAWKPGSTHSSEISCNNKLNHHLCCNLQLNKLQIEQTIQASLEFKLMTFAIPVRTLYHLSFEADVKWWLYNVKSYDLHLMTYLYKNSALKCHTGKQTC